MAVCIICIPVAYIVNLQRLLGLVFRGQQSLINRLWALVLHTCAGPIVLIICVPFNTVYFCIGLFYSDKLHKPDNFKDRYKISDSNLNAYLALLAELYQSNTNKKAWTRTSVNKALNTTLNVAMDIKCILFNYHQANGQSLFDASESG